VATWSPTSLFKRRAHASENLRPMPQKTFATLSANNGLMHRSKLIVDHLDGQREQRGRHGEAERIRGLTINDEFELCRQLDR
jgi:hypothetical protein